MPDAARLLEYREPGTPRPLESAWVMRIERGTTIATLFILLIALPGLYLLGGINIIVLNQLGRFICFAIVALGIDLIWGYCGILSLCQAMFFCIGGYAIGMHMALHGPLDGDGVPRCLFVVTSVVSGFQLPSFWKPFQTLPAAIFLAIFLPGIVAFIFGYFAFRSRVRGVYFSIITQATTLAAWLVFSRNETLLCGTNGLTNFVTLAGLDLTKPSTKLLLYFISVFTLFFVFQLCKYITATRLGRLLVAVRDNESRLRFAGYQPVTLKAFAFTLAAVIAGIGGMLYTPQNGIITPSKMAPDISILMVVWVAVGGRGTLSGAVVGAILTSYIESILTSKFANIWPFFEGALFIGVVLAFPDGLVGGWKKYTRGEKTGPTSLNQSHPMTLPEPRPPTAAKMAAEGAQS